MKLYLKANSKDRKLRKQFNGEPTSEEARLLGTEKGLELWQPITFTGAVKLARIGSRIDNHGGIDHNAVGIWDTSYEGNGSRYFDLYNSKAPIYIIINRSNPREKYQYWPGSTIGRRDILSDINDIILDENQVKIFFEDHPKFAELVNRDNI